MTASLTTLTFDVFGTLVDWYGGLSRELSDVAKRRGWAIDAPALAVEWRRAFFSGIANVRDGERAWTDVDTLNGEAVVRLLTGAGVEPGADDVDVLVSAWRRFAPWPDTVEGMTRLRQRYTLSALSNGTVAQLTDLARHGGLPFHRIIGSDLFRAYKPAPQFYVGALDLLGSEPGRTLMVASHNYDLLAAAAQGMGTAFVRRPLEWGGRQPAEEADPKIETATESLVELAARLGC